MILDSEIDHDVGSSFIMTCACRSQSEYRMVVVLCLLRNLARILNFNTKSAHFYFFTSISCRRRTKQFLLLNECRKNSRIQSLHLFHFIPLLKLKDYCFWRCVERSILLKISYLSSSRNLDGILNFNIKSAHSTIFLFKSPRHMLEV